MSLLSFPESPEMWCLSFFRVPFHLTFYTVFPTAVSASCVSSVLFFRLFSDAYVLLCSSDLPRISVSSSLLGLWACAPMPRLNLHFLLFSPNEFVCFSCYCDCIFPFFMHFSLEWLVLKKIEKQKKNTVCSWSPFTEGRGHVILSVFLQFSVLQAREDAGLRNWRSILEGGC